MVSDFPHKNASSCKKIHRSFLLFCLSIAGKSLLLLAVVLLVDVDNGDIVRLEYLPIIQRFVLFRNSRRSATGIPRIQHGGTCLLALLYCLSGCKVVVSLHNCQKRTSLNRGTFPVNRHTKFHKSRSNLTLNVERIYMLSYSNEILLLCSHITVKMRHFMVFGLFLVSSVTHAVFAH